MRKFLTLLVGVVFLSGCGGADEALVSYNELPIESYDLYDTEEFRMQYPKNWDLLDGELVQERYKSSAKLVLVQDDKDAFFTPNIVVESFSVDESSGLEKTYESVWEDNEESLLIAEEVGRERFTTVANGSVSNGLLVEFTGKRKLEGDVLVYLQALVVAENEAWLATGAFDELDTEAQSAEMVEALKTLAVK